MGLGACSGMWGAALEAERQPAPGAHLFPAAPLPRAASASLEKPAAQETAGGVQTAAPPRPPPPGAPHRDRPTHLKGPWLPGLPPSRRLPPHLRAALFITSAPIPGPRAQAGCGAALIVSGISAPPGAGGDKFSFRKLGGTFSKTPRPRAGESEPLSALSLPLASHQAAQGPPPGLLEPSEEFGAQP